MDVNMKNLFIGVAGKHNSDSINTWSTVAAVHGETPKQVRSLWQVVSYTDGLE